MLTPNEYIDAISQRLQAKFPQDAVEPYRNVVPKDFVRPSCAVWCEGVESGTVNSSSIQADMKFVIDTFAPVNAYQISDIDVLYRRGMIILGIFAPGYLRLTDPDSGMKRAPKVTKCRLLRVGTDYARVEVTLSMLMEITDFEPAEQLPMMEYIELRQGAEL